MFSRNYVILSAVILFLSNLCFGQVDIHFQWEFEQQLLGQNLVREDGYILHGDQTLYYVIPDGQTLLWDINDSVDLHHYF